MVEKIQNYRESKSKALFIWEIYKSVTRRYWKTFPEFLTIGFALCLYFVPKGTGISHEINRVKSVLRQCVRYLRAKKFAIKLPHCKILLFHSSIKPSTQPTTDLLAEKLALRGYRCVVVHSSKEMFIWEKDTSTDKSVRRKTVEGYGEWMLSGIGPLQGIKVVLRSIIVTALLILLFLCLERSLIRVVTKYASQAWHLTLCSAYRMNAMDAILKQLQPEIVMVNNERVSEAAEIVLSKASKKATHILFSSELIYSNLEPIISEEVWLWNDKAKAALEAILLQNSRPRIFIVGNAEADSTLSLSDGKDGKAEKLFNQTKDKRIILFLSQYPLYSFLDDVETDKATESVMGWLEYAAELCPGWHFIFKTRPFHHQVKAKWLGRFAEMDNATIVRDEIEYNQILMWDNLLAIASLMSIGLFVASAVRKTAFRLFVSRKQTAVPVVDEVTIPIHSPEELVQNLLRLEQQERNMENAVNAYLDDDPMFPYRGRVLYRMESLCLEHLRGIPNQRKMVPRVFCKVIGTK